MHNLSDSTPGQSLKPLATFVTIICCLPCVFCPILYPFGTSISFPLARFVSLARLCTMPKVRSRSSNTTRPSTQWPGPSATHGRGWPRCDTSSQQPGTSAGSSASRRRTSMPGIQYPAPIDSPSPPDPTSQRQNTDPAELPRPIYHPLAIVRSEVKRVNTSSTTAGSAQAQLPPSSVALPPPPPSCPGYVVY